jgi:hypothetical protein
MNNAHGAADFGPTSRERSLRWKASRMVDARTLHGVRVRSHLGFVDESTIYSKKADSRRIDRDVRDSDVHPMT